MSGPQNLTWPAEKFLWAVLDAPGLSKAGPLPPGLRGACDEEMSRDDLQVVCAPMGDGTVLACAAPLHALAGLAPETLSLTPASLPPFATDAVVPARLNLLVGRFEPAPIRRVRARRHAVSMATVALCSALLCIGLTRRANVWRGQVRGADAAIRLVARSVVPESASLVAELEQAQRRAGVEVRPPADAAVALASLLSAWPSTVQSRPLTITVGGESASIAVAVEGDPAPFLKALRAPEGWTLQEPRLVTVQDTTRLNLTLRRGGSP